MLKKNIRKKIINLRKINFKEKKNINLSTLINIIKKNNFFNPIVGGYYPINSEIDCLNILKELEKKGYQIALPKIRKNNIMDFHKWSFNEPLSVNKYGIPEPSKNKISYPNIIIIPMVAFDKFNYRIGYGGGYYDRYLDKIGKNFFFISIGFAFSFQKVDRISKSNYDKKLNYIITEKNIIQ